MIYEEWKNGREDVRLNGERAGGPANHIRAKTRPAIIWLSILNKSKSADMYSLGVTLFLFGRAIYLIPNEIITMFNWM